MEVSIALAQFLGLLLILECLIYFFRWRVMAERLTDRSFIALDGYISLVIGAATVALHNMWVADWRIAVTIFGWLLVLRGISRLGFPDLVAKIIPVFTKRMVLMRAGMVGGILFGAWLLWVST